MREAITNIMFDWGVRAFGPDHMTDPRVRALRLLEEAVELAQAAGVARDQAERLVGVVYDRPTGSVLQELGGVQLCTIVLCRTLGVDPDSTLEAEVRRVLAKPPEHFARRNEEKLQLGLTGS